MRVLNPEVMRRIMHTHTYADTCTQPHFSKATSNVFQPGEGRADAETSREAECRENLLQGTGQTEEQQQTAGFGRCVPGQARMGPPVACGAYGSVGGFSLYLNWADVMA